jgi:NAD-dependent dihydropyrimidine dehydrogenase PreA subunit
MQTELVRELVGARRSSKLAEACEESRSGGLCEYVAGDRRDVHPARSFAQSHCANSSREEVGMAYVINEPCIGTKDTSCVEVCPVDCIHPTAEEPGFDEEGQLYIDPEECIDCDACVEACPVDAITPENMVPPEWGDYIERNAAYYRRART